MQEAFIFLSAQLNDPQITEKVQRVNIFLGQG